MSEVKENALVDGRYRIVGQIGSGGMADVFCAQDTTLGRDVALKMLHRRFASDEKFVERFRREASAAAGLQHPHVVNVFDRGEHDGTYYIAMERLTGPTLKEVVVDGGPMPALRAIDLCVQILRAAGFAHRRGVIHRDFKPQNVILTEEDHLKVTDFGIARAGASEMTETGSILGTAHYLSPEQAQGHAVTAASDLYSIGVMLYEMLTGRVPFDGETAVSVAVRHVSDVPPRVSSLRPDVPAALDAAVMRALAKDPAERFASADEFIDALRRARGEALTRENGDGGQATTAFAAVVPPPEEPVADGEEEPEGRRRWPWIALALVALALLGLGIWAATRPDMVAVPAVEGRDVREARTVLERAGFAVETERVRNAAPVNAVVAQDPAPDQEAEEGSTVRLEVSGGPGERRIPEVQGLTRRSAEARLDRAGFESQVEEEASTEVEDGRVIRSSPEENTEARLGSEVTLVVSTGPPPVDVPDLVGLSQESAEAQLRDAGLLAAIGARQPSDQPEGEVVGQDPPAGEEVDQGSRVTLTISSGPPQVEVPDVTTLEVASARTILEENDLEVRVRERATDEPTEDGVVIEQRPDAGEQREAGDTVLLIVGRYEAPEPEEPEEPEPAQPEEPDAQDAPDTETGGQAAQ